MTEEPCGQTFFHKIYHSVKDASCCKEYLIANSPALFTSARESFCGYPFMLNSNSLLPDGSRDGMIKTSFKNESVVDPGPAVVFEVNSLRFALCRKRRFSRVFGAETAWLLICSAVAASLVIHTPPIHPRVAAPCRRRHSI